MILNALFLVATVGLLTCMILFAEELDYRRIIEGIGILVICLWRIKKAKSSDKRIPEKDIYEKTYQEVLDGVFSTDKKSYKKLLKVAKYYNCNKYRKAYKLLRKLEKKCISGSDYAAVYTFYGLCYNEEKRYEEAIAYYEKIPYYVTASTTVWSNLGLCYSKIGKVQEAYMAYSNAIMMDSQNEYAYNNMAFYLIDVNDPQQALTYAFKAIELNANFANAMQAIAIAYKMLGDDENSEKYCKMYGMNGGNVAVLRKYLEEVTLEQAM